MSHNAGSSEFSLQLVTEPSAVAPDPRGQLYTPQEFRAPRCRELMLVELAPASSATALGSVNAS
jgi:hypothetical protein